MGYVLSGLFPNFHVAFQYCERQLSSDRLLLPPGVLGGGLGLCCETASKGMEVHMHLLGCKEDVQYLCECCSLPAAASS